MKSIPLEEVEFFHLDEVWRKNSKRFIASMLFPLIAIPLFSMIPAKYIPSRRNGYDVGDDSLYDMLGPQLAWIIFLSILALLFWAAVAQFKVISLRKDLKQKSKIVLESTVIRSEVYEGERYAKLKKVNGVNFIRFDHAKPYVLHKGDQIQFEVYEHSKILIQLISINGRRVI